MRHSFIDLLREPDSVLFQYEDSDIRFEEPNCREEQNSRIEYIVKDGRGDVILYPSSKPVKRVKLRWRGDMSDVLLVMGDDYDRGMGNIKWPAVFDALDEVGYQGVYNFELSYLFAGEMMEDYTQFIGRYLRRFVDNHGKMR